MLRRLLALNTVALVATLGIAQSGGWREPTSGVVFDPPTNSLRPIAGFLGAAQLGKALAQDLAWASVAPSGTRALVQASSGEISWLEGLDQPAFTAFPLSVPALSRVQARWSSDSSSARVYLAGCNCLVTFALDTSGVPSQSGDAQFLDPSAGVVLDFIWKGLVTVLATDQGLFNLSLNQRTRHVLLTESGLSFFLEPQAKAWAIRRKTGELFEVQLPFSARPLLHLITADTEHLSDLAGVATVSGGLLAADRKTQSLYRIDLASGALSKLSDLEYAPDCLSPLGSQSRWLLRERSRPGEPLLVLDGADTPRVFFVPGGEQQ